MKLLIGAIATILLVIVVLLVELRQVYARERLFIRKYFLTGVFNRQAFFEIATMGLERWRRFNLMYIARNSGSDKIEQGIFE